MKKIIVTLLAIIIALSMLVSCGDNEKGGETGTDTKSTNTEKENKPSSSDDDKIDEESLRKRPENAASDFTYRSYSSDNGEGVEITDYVGTSNIVVIPRQIDGRNVMRINGFVFANKSTVRAVYMPDTVKEIYKVFINNENVELVICDGIKTMAEGEFMNCPSLKKVVLGNELQQIEGYAFYGCGSLVNIDVPNSIDSIGLCAFGGCKNLCNVYIPSSVNSIGSFAFQGCDKLTLIGEAGSYAETYAQENNINFQAK